MKSFRCASHSLCIIWHSQYHKISAAIEGMTRSVNARILHLTATQKNYLWKNESYVKFIFFGLSVSPVCYPYSVISDISFVIYFLFIFSIVFNYLKASVSFIILSAVHSVNFIVYSIYHKNMADTKYVYLETCVLTPCVHWTESNAILDTCIKTKALKRTMITKARWKYEIPKQKFH